MLDRFRKLWGDGPDLRAMELGEFAEAHRFEGRASCGLPIEPSLLPGHEPECLRRIDGRWRGQHTVLFDGHSSRSAYPFLRWLFFSGEFSDPWDYDPFYSCAATAAEHPLGNCALLGDDVGGHYRPSKYRLKHAAPARHAAGWTVAADEPRADAAELVTPAIAKALADLPEGWHFRLTPGQAICVAPAPNWKDGEWPPPRPLLDALADFVKRIEPSVPPS